MAVARLYDYQRNFDLINKIGNVVLLMPKDDEWAGFVAGLSLFTDDFMCNGREDIDHQEREAL